MQVRRQIKDVPWFEIALAALVLAVHFRAATSDAHNFPSTWFSRDDAYYYFKVAQNIASGQGSTFDGLNPTNGYHPLWMLVCLPVFGLASADPILPLRILLLIQGALSALSSILIYRLISSALSVPIAILAASWWAFNIYLHYTMYEFGLETGLAAAAVMGLVYGLYLFETRWRREGLSAARLISLALLATTVMLSRLDLVFLAAFAGLWVILRGTRLRILLPLDLLLAVVSALGAFLVRLGLPDYYLYTDAALLMLAASLVSKVPIYLLFGLYRVDEAVPLISWLRRIILSVAASTALTTVVMVSSAGAVGSFPRTALLYDWAFNVVGLIMLRVFARIFSRPSNHADQPPLAMIGDRWRTWAKEGAVYFGILGGVLGLYMLLNKILIGSSSPVSGQIKRWWGDFSSRVYGGPARNPLSFWGFGFGNDFDAWRPFSAAIQEWTRTVANLADAARPEAMYPLVLVVCASAAIGVLAMDRRMARRGIVQLALPVLGMGALMQVISYNMTGYAGMKEWYWIVQPVFGVLAAAILLSILLKPIQRNPAFNFWFTALALVTGLAMARDFAAWVEERMPHGYYASDLPFMDSARFLEENTPPGAVIGMTGGGNVGYYIRGRTIVNMDGLINSPAYFEALKAGEASDYLSRIGVDYVFANPVILQGPPYRGQYRTGPPLIRFGGKSLMELLP